MRITISTLFFYKPELCLEFVKSLLPTLQEYCARSENTVVLVITENTPILQSCLPSIQDLLSGGGCPNLKFRFRQNSYNLGFGPAHNQVFFEEESDVFIVLNNDLFLASSVASHWLDALCAPLQEDPNVALVGVASSPSIMNAQGEGRWRDSEAQVPEYAEGSLLAVRSSVARALGLFSPDLQIAYYEDTDLSLRYRQAGYRIAMANIPHEHRRGSSSKMLSADLLLSIRKKNQTRFLKRWGLYLARRTLTNRLFLDFTSGGWGDVVSALPTVIGWLRDHPTATIEVQTNQVGLKKILSLSRVEVKTENFQTLWQASESGFYDRVFSLSQVDYSSPLYLGMQIAEQAGTDFDGELALKNLSELTPDSESNLQNVCVVHVQSIRKEWQGRSLEGKTLVPALTLLKERGYSIVLVGTENEPAIRQLATVDLTGKTTIEDLFHLTKSAKLFFGMDSGPLHFAQLAKVPTFAVFGATLPSSRLLYQNSFGYLHPNMDCLGCFHRKLPSPTNYCIRRDEACVRLIDGGHLRKSLSRFLDFTPLESPELFVQRRILSAKQSLRGHESIPSYPDLEDARIRQLLKALGKKLRRALKDKIKRGPA